MKIVMVVFSPMSMGIRVMPHTETMMGMVSSTVKN